MSRTIAAVPITAPATPQPQCLCPWNPGPGPRIGGGPPLKPPGPGPPRKPPGPGWASAIPAAIAATVVIISLLFMFPSLSVDNDERKRPLENRKTKGEKNPDGTTCRPDNSQPTKQPTVRLRTKRRGLRRHRHSTTGHSSVPILHCGRGRHRAYSRQTGNRCTPHTR